VLVQGDWADGSSWTSVIERLQRKGFTVVAPPNLLRGPFTDAPYLASYLESIPGPIVLVAQSYGGFVTTNAATGNDNVKALVYIDAFAPVTGELIVSRTDCCTLDFEPRRRGARKQNRPKARESRIPAGAGDGVHADPPGASAISPGLSKIDQLGACQRRIQPRCPRRRTREIDPVVASRKQPCRL
jgi:pimeloyl-ACP methyl ester carboxylesterase